MHSNLLPLFLGFSTLVWGLPLNPRPQGTCSTPTQRKPWQKLTDSERTDYINATLCLMNTPARHDIPGAKTLWDELHYIHIYQSAYIHFVGAFLPWHRYYLTAHATLLRDACGYKGPMPYWSEVGDQSDLKKAAVFSPKSAFGGDGAGPDRCIADGPFASMRLHFKEDLTVEGSGYCVTRNFSECLFTGAAQLNLDACQAAKSYEEVRNCLEAKPHIAGHWGIGGTMSNTLLSPGDPLFFLHHTWLDLLWWQWQSREPATRLAQITGPNLPGALGHGADKPLNRRLTDYFGDGGGNVTTLGHRLWSAGILANVTVGDVMDLGGAFVCTEFR
ncbi:hypothetical protein B0T25DRAFT_499703 [Lasiosphaeria hispida]|uniref:Tyrosinase copper-binding domain-containing protein n=1 Tax=Lasiosphaeria hispida TaxID=260671 RepID=A0AAJ0HNG8_9PEZI|nr:hypothetical protein B0T25DRAFT_499703 [Lasiosphaeria hispida]